MAVENQVVSPLTEATPRFQIGKSFDAPTVPVVPTPPLPDIDTGSYQAAMQELAALTDILTVGGGMKGLDQGQQKRFRDLTSFIEKKDEESKQAAWQNSLYTSILPSLFTNPFEKLESNRDYGYMLEQGQREYDLALQQGQREDALNAERNQRENARVMREEAALKRQEDSNQQSRVNAFNVMTTLNKTFPSLGIDTSAFGGELDPDLLGPLVQIALAKASQRNQVMAQPKYQMPV